jgi:hypothetical protein
MVQSITFSWKTDTFFTPLKNKNALLCNPPTHSFNQSLTHFTPSSSTHHHASPHCLHI